MAQQPPLTASAASIAQEFSHYSDVSLTRPVVVTKNGRPRNVLLSFEEYNRLKSRDRVTFRAEDTPDEWVRALETLSADLAADPVAETA